MPVDLTTETAPIEPMDPGILDASRSVVFFPVRHHSPACARCLVDLMRAMRPRTVLIEGPSDYNDRLDELSLPHQLPIAIYSFFEIELSAPDATDLSAPPRPPQTGRAGAFYPFCVYSPEWQALTAARELGAECRFIDLPWRDVAAKDRTANRYADAEMSRSAYVAALCAELGVEDLNGLWDTLFEIDHDLTPAEYMRRAHTFCYNMRLADRHPPAVDLEREAFMADQIRAATAGPVLVVTGGYHSYGLYARLNGIAFSGNEPAPAPSTDDDPPAAEPAERPVTITRTGLALTPYSYARLDGLRGYDAGMPNPGFYHEAWVDRHRSPESVYRTLVARAVSGLRERGQVASTADLIALDTVAGGLAALRGHRRVWRLDVLDAVVGALIKDELTVGGSHPLLDAVHAVFRGDARGRIADGAALPPLVYDIRRLLEDHDIVPDVEPRKIAVDLAVPAGLARSRVLHALRLLAIPGFVRTGSVDFAQRADLVDYRETWTIVWQPEQDAAFIESSLYGSGLVDAALSRLRERAAAADRSAADAATVLLDACLMGAPLDDSLIGGLTDVVRKDPEFFSVAAALGDLLYLFRFDEALGVAGDLGIGALLVETFDRGLWLLETLGHPQGADQSLVDGVRSLVDTCQRCRASVPMRGDELLAVLERIGDDAGQAPLLRGAARGGVWILGAVEIETLVGDLAGLPTGEAVGDYLTGLFHLAREVAQRHPQLMAALDRILVEYTDDEYLEALPAMRLAFSYFTPREKHHMIRTLFAELGLLGEEAGEPPDLEVSPADAAAAIGFEGRLYAALARYGVRGALPGEAADGRS